jgi:hypothetical protein
MPSSTLQFMCGLSGHGKPETAKWAHFFLLFGPDRVKKQQTYRYTDVAIIIIGNSFTYTITEKLNISTLKSGRQDPQVPSNFISSSIPKTDEVTTFIITFNSFV